MDPKLIARYDVLTALIKGVDAHLASVDAVGVQTPTWMVLGGEVEAGRWVPIPWHKHVFSEAADSVLGAEALGDDAPRGGPAQAPEVPTTDGVGAEAEAEAEEESADAPVGREDLNRMKRFVGAVMVRQRRGGEGCAVGAVGGAKRKVASMKRSRDIFSLVMPSPSVPYDTTTSDSGNHSRQPPFLITRFTTRAPLSLLDRRPFCNPPRRQERESYLRFLAKGGYLSLPSGAEGNERSVAAKDTLAVVPTEASQSFSSSQTNRKVAVVASGEEATPATMTTTTPLAGGASTNSSNGNTKTSSSPSLSSASPHPSSSPSVVAAKGLWAQCCKEVMLYHAVVGETAKAMAVEVAADSIARQATFGAASPPGPAFGVSAKRLALGTSQAHQRHSSSTAPSTVAAAGGVISAALDTLPPPLRDAMPTIMSHFRHHTLQHHHQLLLQLARSSSTAAANASPSSNHSISNHLHTNTTINVFSPFSSSTSSSSNGAPAQRKLICPIGGGGGGRRTESPAVGLFHRLPMPLVSLGRRLEGLVAASQSLTSLAAAGASLPASGAAPSGGVLATRVNVGGSRKALAPQQEGPSAAAGADGSSADHAAPLLLPSLITFSNPESLLSLCPLLGQPQFGGVGVGVVSGISPPPPVVFSFGGSLPPLSSSVPASEGSVHRRLGIAQGRAHLEALLAMMVGSAHHHYSEGSDGGGHRHQQSACRVAVAAAPFPPSALASVAGRNKLFAAVSQAMVSFFGAYSGLPPSPSSSSLSPSSAPHAAFVAVSPSALAAPLILEGFYTAAGRGGIGGKGRGFISLTPSACGGGAQRRGGGGGGEVDSVALALLDVISRCVLRSSTPLSLPAAHAYCDEDVGLGGGGALAQWSRYPIQSHLGLVVVPSTSSQNESQLHGTPQALSSQGPGGGGVGEEDADGGVASPQSSMGSMGGAGVSGDEVGSGSARPSTLTLQWRGGPSALSSSSGAFAPTAQFTVASCPRFGLSPAAGMDEYYYALGQAVVGSSGGGTTTTTTMASAHLSPIPFSVAALALSAAVGNPCLRDDIARFLKARREAEQQARLRALRSSDAEAYMAHLSDVKVGSLLKIMETTHKFMMKVGAQLSRKGDEAAVVTTTAASGGGGDTAADAVLKQHESARNSSSGSGGVAEDSEYRRFKEYVRSTKDEYKLVHQVETFVTSQPSGLHANLMSHQIVGLRFLVSLHANGINGILADEMGVGKTIQTLAFLLYLKEERIRKAGLTPLYDGLDAEDNTAAVTPVGEGKPAEGDVSTDATNALPPNPLPPPLGKDRIVIPNLVLAPLSIIREWRDACGQFVPRAIKVCELHELEVDTESDAGSSDDDDEGSSDEDAAAVAPRRAAPPAPKRRSGDASSNSDDSSSGSSESDDDDDDDSDDEDSDYSPSEDSDDEDDDSDDFDSSDDDGPRRRRRPSATAFSARGRGGGGGRSATTKATAEGKGGARSASSSNKKKKVVDFDQYYEQQKAKKAKAQRKREKDARQMGRGRSATVAKTAAKKPKSTTTTNNAAKTKPRRTPWERALDYDIVLLAIHRTKDMSRELRVNVPWGYIVVDEAHKAVSNLGTITAQAISAINFQRRLVLTGTPLNNDLQELWSLLHFINPDIFSTQDSFEDVFRRPFQEADSAASTGRGKSGASSSSSFSTVGKTPQQIQEQRARIAEEQRFQRQLAQDVQLKEEEKQLLIMRMHQILRPFMLRRTKKDIDTSLKITFHEVKCPLTVVQRALLKLMRERKVLPHVIAEPKRAYVEGHYSRSGGRKAIGSGNEEARRALMLSDRQMNQYRPMVAGAGAGGSSSSPPALLLPPPPAAVPPNHASLLSPYLGFVDDSATDSDTDIEELPKTAAQQKLLAANRPIKRFPHGPIAYASCQLRSVTTITSTAQAICNHPFMIPFFSRLMAREAERQVARVINVYRKIRKDKEMVRIRAEERERKRLAAAEKRRLTVLLKKQQQEEEARLKRLEEGGGAVADDAEGLVSVEGEAAVQQKSQGGVGAPGPIATPTPTPTPVEDGSTNATPQATATTLPSDLTSAANGIPLPSLPPPPPPPPPPHPYVVQKEEEATLRRLVTSLLDGSPVPEDLAEDPMVLEVMCAVAKDNDDAAAAGEGGGRCDGKVAKRRRKEEVPSSSSDDDDASDRDTVRASGSRTRQQAAKQKGAGKKKGTTEKATAASKKATKAKASETTSTSASAGADAASCSSSPLAANPRDVPLCYPFTSFNLSAARSAELTLSCSGKFIVLDMMLRRLKLLNKKVVIFSHWLDCIDLLSEYLDGCGWRGQHVALTGAASADERKASVDRFRTDPSMLVFIVSVKAGGCGLNLQVANIVIMLDRDYTATNEDQAIARVFRIGQKNTVRAISLCTDDAAEARILAISDKKNKPREALIEGGGYNVGTTDSDRQKAVANSMKSKKHLTYSSSSCTSTMATASAATTGDGGDGEGAGDNDEMGVGEGGKEEEEGGDTPANDDAFIDLSDLEKLSPLLFMQQQIERRVETTTATAVPAAGPCGGGGRGRKKAVPPPTAAVAVATATVETVMRPIDASAATLEHFNSPLFDGNLSAPPAAAGGASSLWYPPSSFDARDVERLKVLTHAFDRIMLAESDYVPITTKPTTCGADGSSFPSAHSVLVDGETDNAAAAEAAAVTAGGDGDNAPPRYECPARDILAKSGITYRPLYQHFDWSLGLSGSGDGDRGDISSTGASASSSSYSRVPLLITKAFVECGLDIGPDEDHNDGDDDDQRKRSSGTCSVGGSGGIVSRGSRAAAAFAAREAAEKAAAAAAAAAKAAKSAAGGTSTPPRHHNDLLTAAAAVDPSKVVASCWFTRLAESVARSTAQVPLLVAVAAAPNVADADADAAVTKGVAEGGGVSISLPLCPASSAMGAPQGDTCTAAVVDADVEVVVVGAESKGMKKRGGGGKRARDGGDADGLVDDARSDKAPSDRVGTPPAAAASPSPPAQEGVGGAVSSTPNTAAPNSDEDPPTVARRGRGRPRKVVAGASGSSSPLSPPPAGVTVETINDTNDTAVGVVEVSLCAASPSVLSPARALLGQMMMPSCQRTEGRAAASSPTSTSNIHVEGEVVAVSPAAAGVAASPSSSSSSSLPSFALAHSPSSNAITTAAVAATPSAATSLLMATLGIGGSSARSSAAAVTVARRNLTSCMSPGSAADMAGMAPPPPPPSTLPRAVSHGFNRETATLAGATAADGGDPSSSFSSFASPIAATLEKVSQFALVKSSGDDAADSSFPNTTVCSLPAHYNKSIATIDGVSKSSTRKCLRPSSSAAMGISGFSGAALDYGDAEE